MTAARRTRSSAPWTSSAGSRSSSRLRASRPDEGTGYRVAAGVDAARVASGRSIIARVTLVGRTAARATIRRAGSSVMWCPRRACAWARQLRSPRWKPSGTGRGANSTLMRGAGRTTPSATTSAVRCRPGRRRPALLSGEGVGRRGLRDPTRAGPTALLCVTGRLAPSSPGRPRGGGKQALDHLAWCASAP